LASVSRTIVCPVSVTAPGLLLSLSTVSVNATDDGPDTAETSVARRMGVPVLSWMTTSRTSPDTDGEAVTVSSSDPDVDTDADAVPTDDWMPDCGRAASVPSLPSTTVSRDSADWLIIASRSAVYPLLSIAYVSRLVPPTVPLAPTVTPTSVSTIRTFSTRLLSDCAGRISTR